MLNLRQIALRRTRAAFAENAVPLQICVKALRRALDFGSNAVDTASGYDIGHGEQIVRACSKCGARRDVRH